MPSSPPSDPRLRLIVESHERLTGKPLLDSLPQDDESLCRALWDAPCAIVAHGTEADPVFFYGNRYALRCFGMDFDEFTRLPSRLSAEPLVREERARLLERVARQGYIDDYAGVRVAKSGRRFTIEGATVWNLVDEAGVIRGQAAVFAVPE